MTAPFAFARSFASAETRSSGVTACTVSVCSKSSRLSVSNGVRGNGPHAKITSSIAPIFVRTPWAIVSTASGFVRSATTNGAGARIPAARPESCSSADMASSLFGSRAVSATRSPRATRAREMATPSRPVAPTTSVILPLAFCGRSEPVAIATCLFARPLGANQCKTR